MIYVRTLVAIYLVIAIWKTSHIQALSEGDLRLINDTTLEVFFDSTWGSICDDFWSFANTDVVCRQLGYRSGRSFKTGVTSNNASAIFHLDNLVCIGNESSIFDCKYDNKSNDCTKHEHIQITCENEGCQSYAPFADSVETIVEYFIEQKWYYISEENFTVENAAVICYENTKTGYESHTFQLRSSSLRIYPYHIRCIGNESSLCECNRSQTTHSSRYIVKIKCSSSEGQLKLINGIDRNSGYILINHDEAWKTICLSSNRSHFQLASVACRNLGYRGVYNYYYDESASFSIESGGIFQSGRNFQSWIWGPKCNGNEKSLTECTSSNDQKDFTCGENPLWVNCEPYDQHDVRLVGNDSFAGRTYVFYENQWRYLCLPDGFLSIALGEAVCRSIGALSYNNYSSERYTGVDYLNMEYRCFGNETNLVSCFSLPLENQNCEILNIQCTPPLDKSPRISYGSRESGLVEIYQNGKWGLACTNGSKDFEQSDAQVICRQLGLSGGYLQHFFYSITGTHNYWNSAFNCSGTESNLREANCLQTTIYNDTCPGNGLIKIFCSPSKNQIRLFPFPTNITGLSKVQFLNPERTWSSVCEDSQIENIELCQKFGFNSTNNNTTQVRQTKYHYAFLKCTTSDVDQCNLQFEYDYIFIHGCLNIFKAVCTNLQVPTLIPENLQIEVLSHHSILVIWDYVYDVTEENMGIFYRYELSTDLVTCEPVQFQASNWKTDFSRVSRRYQVLNNLTALTTYVLKLQMGNSAGFGPYGNTVTFTTENVKRPNKSITIRTLSELEEYLYKQECKSYATPQPDVEEEDMRSIRVRIDIDLTDEIEKLENVTVEIVKKFSTIIAKNIGVNVTYEEPSVSRELIDRNADHLLNLVIKYNKSDISGEDKKEAIGSILQPAGDIIQKDIELTYNQTDNGNTMVEEGDVAIASKGLTDTLDSLEILGSSLIIDIPTNITTSVYISSPTITLIAENYLLSAENDSSMITIPNSSTIEDKGIEERIQIPVQVARLLSTNNNTNFKIGTAIVKNTLKPKGRDSDKKATNLFSNIITVVIPGYENRVQMIPLPEPVRILVPVISEKASNKQQICSFLNNSLWSTNGLTTDATEYNVTYCYTDHFTSFAVFVTPRESPIDDLSRIASLVSYVLVSISLVALVVSLILFIISGKYFFKVEANIVYFNYCLAMTLAFGLFLFGIESGKFHPIACMVIAFLLHYIWLAVFVWTLCNGILIVYKLTIGILRDHKIYPYLICFGWISPIIIPIITIAIKHKNYVKSEEHCFITYQDGIIWSFIGPILIILAMNMIILVFASIRIATVKFSTDKFDEKHALKKGILSSLILTPLLGIPWVLLLVNVFISDPIFQWVFIIVNSLMGLFFFIAVTLRNTEVKLLCTRSSKIVQPPSTSITGSRTNEMMSNRFKPINPKHREQVPSSTGATNKGEYITLDPVLTDAYSTTSHELFPRPKNRLNPKGYTKGLTDTTEYPHDIPEDVKPIEPSSIYDYLKPKTGSSVYTGIDGLENNMTEFGNKHQSDSTCVSDEKLYQNLNTIS